MIHKAKAILKNIFGHDGFIHPQGDVVESILEGNDTIAIMPTGGGKSICYQVPALVFDGLTVVVSPLISLMQDQVGQLLAIGVPAATLNSQLPAKVYRENVNKIKAGVVKILYLAPETFMKKSILELLSTINISCIAIDEAHCISQWGHDFRPKYRRLSETRQIFKGAVFVAVTATATPTVKRDIVENLMLENANEFNASFDRPNLFISVSDKSSPLWQTLQFIESNAGGQGVVYCFSRRVTENICSHLVKNGISAKPYHAGMSGKERTKSQEMFMSGKTQVMVATIAFGMGINKPDVRFVLHYNMPQTIEGYYQEIGRAGRDGKRAECLMLFHRNDIRDIRYVMQFKKDQERRIAGEQFGKLLEFVETTPCRRTLLLKYFGENYTGRCGMCDNCTQSRSLRGNRDSSQLLYSKKSSHISRVRAA